MGDVGFVLFLFAEGVVVWVLTGAALEGQLDQFRPLRAIAALWTALVNVMSSILKAPSRFIAATRRFKFH
ncbi:hypothetical protein BPY_23180 [Bifidobacterium psychraerophilum]